jgi:MFS family permease
MCAANPMWVRISDIWGRKYAVLGAIAVFFIGSTIAGAAVDMPMLISGRGVQGLAGGGIISLVNIVISDLFSMRHRSLYISARLGGCWNYRAGHWRCIVAVCTFPERFIPY